jgi:mannose-1-phosphate guanylyltransferase
MAGGDGRRLARMTRALTGVPRPKQYCSFTPDGPTLLQQTVERAQRLTDGPTRVVVRREHALLAEHQTGRYARCRLLVQPHDRGTAIGLLLALVDLVIEAPSAQLVVLPADHGFADEEVLATTLDDAMAAVEADPSRIVLLAAEPDRAATDYGWMVPRDGDAGAVCALRHFVEKPDVDTASWLLRSGGAWSTMMVVSTARRLLELFIDYAPILVRMFVFHAALPTGERQLFLERAYSQLHAIDLSADVLEKGAQLSMLLLPRAAGWSDLGTEERIHAWLNRSPPPPRSSPIHKARLAHETAEVA